MRYAGLGTQLLAAIGLAVFAGLKADKWLHTSPLLACILPLLILSRYLLQIVQGNSKKKPND